MAWLEYHGSLRGCFTNKLFANFCRLFTHLVPMPHFISPFSSVSTVDFGLVNISWVYFVTLPTAQYNKNLVKQFFHTNLELLNKSESLIHNIF